jgi:ankyrin repeat protein
MDRIEGQLKDQEELAKQALSWITCAKRPLSTTELQHALGVEMGETELDPDNIPLVEDIVSVCAGLVTLDEESNVIRLVHYTTQEYFGRTWKRWFPGAQADIRDVCATYLSFSSFKDGACSTDADFEERLRLNQLYDYAAHYWGEHARVAGGISQVALDLLTSDSLLEAQVQALMTVKYVWSRAFYSQRFPKRMQGLLVAAYFGILEAVETLLQSSDNNDLKDSFGWTPLSLAAKNGHEAVVKMLLETGKVDVNSKDIRGQTPLSGAAKNGYLAVVKILLDTGKVDVDSEDDISRTPLSWAAENGHLAVVKMLLETGIVDVDSEDDIGQTPLSRAAEDGQEAVVKMLLETGKVDVDSKDKTGRTPLLGAAKNGYLAVVKMLLDTGNVNVDLKDIDGQTPLSWAAQKGHLAVVKMLLDTGKVDIESKDIHGRTPLSFAAGGSNEAVVKMLLETGKADVDSKADNGWTPVSYAVWAGRRTMVEILRNSRGTADDPTARPPVASNSW